MILFHLLLVASTQLIIKFDALSTSLEVCWLHAIHEFSFPISFWKLRISNCMVSSLIKIVHILGLRLKGTVSSCIMNSG